MEQRMKRFFRATIAWVLPFLLVYLLYGAYIGGVAAARDMEFYPESTMERVMADSGLPQYEYSNFKPVKGDSNLLTVPQQLGLVSPYDVLNFASKQESAVLLGENGQDYQNKRRFYLRI